MAYQEQLISISVEAAADLSARQYRFMQVDSNGQINTSGAAGRPDGVLQNDPSAVGEAGELGIAGVSIVEAGAALSAGVEVTSDSVGRAVAAASGDEISGVTLQAATGAGSLIAVLLKLK